MAKLTPAFAFSLGGEKQRGQESQPLVYDGVIYLTGSYSRMYAVDARTGALKWEYDAHLPDGIVPCCDVVNRGAAIYGDKVYFGTLDAKIVALNRETGKVIWTKTIADFKEGYSYTAAPIIVNGKLITGVSGGEFGVVGRVEARDLETGEIIWTRPTLEGYTGTTIAIDSDTGVIQWHYQTTPHDGWDFDGSNEFVPFDMTVNGKTVKAGGKADRKGFFFVLDRTNGKFISATPFVSKITWASGYDKSGRPIYIDSNRPSLNEGTMDRDTAKKVFVAPSFLGAKNWMPMSYSPDTQLFYVPSKEWGMDIWDTPIAYKKGAAFLGSEFNVKPVHDDYIGALRAVDPKTGKIVWEVKNKAPLWGGVMTTAGNLVFTGTPEGYFKAFDAKTGKELWKFQTGSGVVGQPITWRQDGQQYIAVMSGWGGAVPLWGGEVAKTFKGISQGRMLWVLKLPSAWSRELDHEAGGAASSRPALIH